MAIRTIPFFYFLCRVDLFRTNLGLCVDLFVSSYMSNNS